MHFDIKRRLFYLAIGIVVFVISYSIGAATDLNRSEAENLRQQFNEQVKDIDQYGIFVNNLRISLGMFVPAIGVALGVFSGFSTGLVFNVLASSTPLLSNISPLALLITPFGITEVFAYGLAMSRSGILIYQIVKRKQWRNHIIPTIIEIGIVVLILLIAAIIEWQMITQFSERVTDMPF